ncbi:hypothetical protein EV122DRAFT_282517 [Schizophyllum commune]
MGGGPCSICNRWAGGPPVSSDLRMRLCGSTHCWTELFSDTYSTETWSLGLFPKGETALYDLPFEASEWIPYVVDDDYVSELTPNRPVTVTLPWLSFVYPRRRYLVCEQSEAFFELIASGIAYRSQDCAWELGHLPKEALLIEEYDLATLNSLCLRFTQRCQRHRALEASGKEELQSSKYRLCQIASEQDLCIDHVLGDPLVQRICAAFDRDGAYADFSAFRHLEQGPVPSETVLNPRDFMFPGLDDTDELWADIPTGTASLQLPEDEQHTEDLVSVLVSSDATYDEPAQLSSEAPQTRTDSSPDRGARIKIKVRKARLRKSLVKKFVKKYKDGIES